jgi:DNA-binding transcriptional regulator YiaG
MEAITPEIIPSEKKRDARGHRLYDEERQRRVLEGYDQSGLTQKAYAKREGIKYSTLVSWLQGRIRPAGYHRTELDATN